MRQAAIDAARAVNYVGAGTVEFIVEQDGTAYFMEMNTRLQVEHPVTEMITGQDLVEWQLRVAYGEALPKQQHELRIHGHALEARVYAEEPEKGFLPAIGQIHYLSYPTQNAHVRVDSGIVEGDEITTYYDPMIAKLIVWGENREAALTQMHHALSQFHVDGLGNNIAFLDRLVRCESFANAHLDTGLIQREEAFLLGPQPQVSPELVVSAALTELLSRFASNKTANNPVWQAASLWRVNINARYAVKFAINGIENVVHFTSQGTGYVAEYQGQSYVINGQLLNAHQVKIELAGRKTDYAFSLSDSGLTVYHNGQSHHFAHIQPSFNNQDDSADAGNLKAPMPGVITQVLVQPNSQVKKDDVLLTLEAMKIEYSIRAPQDGVVAAAYFQKGDQVKAGDELVEFVALEDVA
jgi:3-methylcrotonyl-CoA carboxylase alpha subunit